jgi:uncharacterized protein (DUF427 family)
MKAIVGNTVIAEASDEELVTIEGNWYFPPTAVAAMSLQVSATSYTCPWKGAAKYFSVIADGSVLTDAAWCYPAPYSSALHLVGNNFARYVAFDLSRVDLLDHADELLNRS